MSAEDLKDLKPVYLIWGAEELLLEEAVDRLRQRLAKVADLDYNLHVFDGETADVDDIVNSANTLPFMSERKLVVVKRADRLDAAASGRLADYAEDPAEHTCLVLVAEKVDKRQRLFKVVDAAGGTHEYSPPKRGEYPARVVAMFGAKGKRIGIEGAEVLVEAVGRDLRRLAVEVGKVCAYVGDAGTLTREDVERVMSLTAPTSVWEYLDAIGTRDAREALRLLADLMDEGESPLGVWALTVRHLRQLVAARALLDRGEGTGAIMREVGMADWQARKIEGQARRFEPAELNAAVRAAAATEAEMKTSRDARLALENWVIGTCSGR